MPKEHSLGDLQHAIMRVLWERGEMPVADVHQALLEERGLALTTIATMLTKMEKKGVVSRRIEGRGFVYAASISEKEVNRSMVSDLTDQLFRGDAAALVSHLLTEQQIDRGELNAIKELIERHATRQGSKAQSRASRSQRGGQS
ncbi:MAG: BlaI/MecI/CopY family transcriptional regulator [Planctomycetota bacterium]